MFYLALLEYKINSLPERVWQFSTFKRAAILAGIDSLIEWESYV